MTASEKELNLYIKQLTNEEKKQLAAELKKQLLLAEAQRLSAFKPRKAIPMQEIVKEVRIVRKKRNAA
ncbi:MAG: hypothetical protein ACHQF0_17945 [Chitinophagales bacterium]